MVTEDLLRLLGEGSVFFVDVGDVGGRTLMLGVPGVAAVSIAVETILLGPKTSTRDVLGMGRAKRPAVKSDE